MLERKNSLKRSGFKRPVMERKPVVHKPLDPKHRRVVNTGPVEGEVQPIQKNPPGRNQAYRDLAKGKECMLRVPGVCCRNSETTVLAHSNSMANGKGMGLKADDAIGAVWACYTCHMWADQGKAPRELKDAAFDLGVKRMETQLEQIIADPQAKPRDRSAAEWALERIRAVAS